MIRALLKRFIVWILAYGVETKSAAAELDEMARELNRPTG